MFNTKFNDMEMNIDLEWNKCSNESKLFLLCMKKPKVENKCKNLFDEWFKCINTNPITLTNQTIKHK
jgi:hypothetical protein